MSAARLGGLPGRALAVLAVAPSLLLGVWLVSYLGDLVEGTS